MDADERMKWNVKQDAHTHTNNKNEATTKHNEEENRRRGEFWFASRIIIILTNQTKPTWPPPKSNSECVHTGCLCVPCPSISQSRIRREPRN